MLSWQKINQKGLLALQRNNKPRFASEAGVGHLLLIVAVVGLLGFFLITNTFNFKDQLFSTLFPKPPSEAQEISQEIDKLTKDLLGEAKLDEVQKPVNNKNLADKAKRRKELLLKEAENNPQEFLKHAILIDKRESFTEEIKLNIEQHQQIKGKLRVVHMDDFEGKKSKFEYFLEDPSTIRQSGFKVTAEPKSIKLHFVKNPPKLLTDTEVVVTGLSIDNNLVLETGDKTGPNYNLKKDDKVLGLGTYALGEQKTVVLLVNFSNDTSRPVTTDQIKSLMFNPTNSLAGYYKENSYNKASFSGEVYGWLTIPSSNSGCPYYQWGDEADLVARAAGVNLDQYQRKVYVFPSSVNCSYGGFGTIGGNPSISWIFSSLTDLRIYAHEMGHNLGVHHANLADCSVGSVDYLNCSNLEYGDYYDVMGNFWNVTPDMLHFNGPHKVAENWLPPENVKELTGSGTYTISDIETASTETQILKIPLPNYWSYYISYRQGFGYDANLPPGITGGVSVHLWNDDNWWQTRLIDTTLGTRGYINDSSLSDGLTFQDTLYNVSVKQTSHTARLGTLPGKATVDVSYVPSPKGAISASPNPCTIALGASTCITTITWSTANATNVTVKEGGKVFATGTSGSQQATFITNHGNNFELYSDDIFLTSVWVYGIEPPNPPTIKVNVSCINPGYVGSDVLVSWTDENIYYVDFSLNPDFYNISWKYVSPAKSTTAPLGFYGTIYGPYGPLVLNPDTTYYVRLWGAGDGGSPASFKINKCPTEKKVFVTKSTYNGNLGGLTGADQKCQSAADAAKLGGTFKAWLSSSTISASSRLTHAKLPYKLLNGKVVGSNWDDIVLNGYIQNPINITETGAPADGMETNAVWTNTNGFGNIFSQYTSCNNWTYGPEYISGSDPYSGKSGMMNSNSAWWTADNYTSSCARKSRLYCFEQ